MQSILSVLVLLPCLVGWLVTPFANWLLVLTLAGLLPSGYFVIYCYRKSKPEVTIETDREKICRYYVEVLRLYGNKPQLREYLVFYGINDIDIESYEKGVHLAEQMKLIA